MLKMTFLGSGSAFTINDDNFQSNVLLQLNNDSLLLDAGTDIRFSLSKLQLSYQDIKNVYVSHLHSDHIGGLEWLALTTKFDRSDVKKPGLFAAEQIIKELWEKSLSGGLRTIATEAPSLASFYQVHAIKKYQGFCWQGIVFKLVQTVHIVCNYELMPCYGLLFSYNDKRIFYTSDTQYVLTQLLDCYRTADIIFQDCETAATKSGVHAHYSDLVNLPAEFKQKMWLYHYNPGPLPDAVTDGFLGFVKRGQSFLF